ncbi:hypothetical protein MBM_03548 [Drepanopeziza brunnea f. sp. 'multigermtubi' MB_m1]|uniref:Cyclin-like f-box protein n=2 Tax=Drepanopeziza brunnea f. sp. 'multigermtubi' TaxID=698441 RepID=K1WLG3_MARBU|nr:uncharacterized protein MBM_03548 [Drepanopeziza brunnea f. sp. 'multigermtubi' MB_m1]EKD18555.1 hypothetical protein MBM_03548 [Drepanopeziza brunnea f. sp. 'multigermtubi' MB_m1]
MQESWIRLFCFALLALFALPVESLPKKNGNAGASDGSNGVAVPTTITQATDGSMILDKSVQINGLNIRYKISAPANQFTAASGVPGGTATGNGTMGVNVLLHGDGGQSFFDFPNQAVQDNKMGVVVLAPNTKMFWGGGSGLQRTDGVAHAAAVNTLIQTQMAQDVSFDPGNVYFTGVSGGSLLMSGYFVPAYGAMYKTGVVLNCGGMAPQVAVVDSANLISNMKIHFQSTKDELSLLQGSIPQSVMAYEKLATDAGLSADQIGALQTVDNTPNGGGHCGFDGQGFVSGIQLVMNGYSNIIGTNPSGNVTGISQNVLTTVVGNENVVFTSAT